MKPVVISGRVCHNECMGRPEGNLSPLKRIANRARSREDKSGGGRPDSAGGSVAKDAQEKRHTLTISRRDAIFLGGGASGHALGRFFFGRNTRSETLAANPETTSSKELTGIDALAEQALQQLLKLKEALLLSETQFDSLIELLDNRDVSPEFAAWLERSQEAMHANVREYAAVKVESAFARAYEGKVGLAQYGQVIPATESSPGFYNGIDYAVSFTGGESPYYNAYGLLDLYPAYTDFVDVSPGLLGLMNLERLYEPDSQSPTVTSFSDLLLRAARSLMGGAISSEISYLDVFHPEDFLPFITGVAIAAQAVLEKVQSLSDEQLQVLASSVELEYLAGNFLNENAKLLVEAVAPKEYDRMVAQYNIVDGEQQSVVAQKELVLFSLKYLTARAQRQTTLGDDIELHRQVIGRKVCEGLIAEVLNSLPQISRLAEGVQQRGQSLFLPQYAVAFPALQQLYAQGAQLPEQDRELQRRHVPESVVAERVQYLQDFYSLQLIGQDSDGESDFHFWNLQTSGNGVGDYALMSTNGQLTALAAARQGEQASLLEHVTRINQETRLDFDRVFFVDTESIIDAPDHTQMLNTQTGEITTEAGTLVFNSETGSDASNTAVPLSAQLRAEIEAALAAGKEVQVFTFNEAKKTDGALFRIAGEWRLSLVRRLLGFTRNSEVVDGQMLLKLPSALNVGPYESVLARGVPSYAALAAYVGLAENEYISNFFIGDSFSVPRNSEIVTDSEGVRVASSSLLSAEPQHLHFADPDLDKKIYRIRVDITAQNADGTTSERSEVVAADRSALILEPQTSVSSLNLLESAAGRKYQQERWYRQQQPKLEKMGFAVAEAPIGNEYQLAHPQLSHLDIRFNLDTEKIEVRARTAGNYELAPYYSGSNFALVELGAHSIRNVSNFYGEYFSVYENALRVAGKQRDRGFYYFPTSRGDMVIELNPDEPGFENLDDLAEVKRLLETVEVYAAGPVAVLRYKQGLELDYDLEKIKMHLAPITKCTLMLSLGKLAFVFNEFPGIETFAQQGVAESPDLHMPILPNFSDKIIAVQRIDPLPGPITRTRALVYFEDGSSPNAIHLEQLVDIPND